MFVQDLYNMVYLLTHIWTCVCNLWKEKLKIKINYEMYNKK